LNSDEIYDRIQEIKKASGAFSKQRLLHEDMKPYLLYTYDPFRKFYITTHSATGQGKNYICELGFTLLDQLTTCELTGYQAIKTLTMYLERLTPKSAKLFKLILAKNWRMGLAEKGINTKFPGLIPWHPIMRAKPFEEHRCRYPMFGEPKYHGNRAVYNHDKEQFFSRNGHLIVGVDHIIEQVYKLDISFDGELRDLGMSFQKSNGQINSLDPSPDAEYFIFAEYKTKLPYFEMRMLLEDVDLNRAPIHLVHSEPINSVDEAYSFYNVCRKLNNNYRFKMFDGAIIKSARHIYQDKRSYDWMKLKDIESATLRCTGMYEGKGKYVGHMGGIFVNFRGVSVKVGTGFDDEDRFRYYREPDTIVGRLVEVLYQEVTDDGSLRDPRFDGLRFDKEVADDEKTRS